jgi:hypothetical protein
MHNMLLANGGIEPQWLKPFTIVGEGAVVR